MDESAGHVEKHMEIYGNQWKVHFLLATKNIEMIVVCESFLRPDWFLQRVGDQTRSETKKLAKKGNNWWGKTVLHG
jgi:hypothetical protein